MRFNDFKKIKTVKSSGTDSTTLNFMTRVANTLFMGSSLLFYNKYSRILYEGDKFDVFGIATYNPYSDYWEVSKPLAFMKEGAGKFIWHLKKENFASGFGILFRGIFAYYLMKGAFWAVKSLVSRIHRRLVNVYRAAFNRQD